MAHPVPASRSLEFFLDLGNLSGSVRGGTVVLPPNNEAQWKAQGVGTHIGWEWTVMQAGQTEVDEDAVAVSAGSVYWDTVTLGLENGPEPLYGYKVYARGYQDDTTMTPVYETDEDGNEVLVDEIWENTRTYPAQTGVTAKFKNSQTRVPPLWPRPDAAKTDQMRELEEQSGMLWSTAIRPRQFEGPALYGDDKTESPGGGDAFIFGISEGRPRCRGFVENRTNLHENLTPPNDFYIAVDECRGYVRTPDNRIQPFVNNNDDWNDVADITGNHRGVTIPIVPSDYAEPGTFRRFQGRITRPEELPRATFDRPIPIGVTYIQQDGGVDPWDPDFVIPFAGFIGRHAWTYTGVEYFNPETGERMKDRFGNDIEDFRWERSTKPETASGYNYVLVFDEALFNYIQRLGGPYRDEIHVINPAVTGLWFPTEPFDEARNPPLYPYDTIPSFVPDEREMVDVDYTIEITGSPAGAGSLSWSQTCLAPTRNWQKMLKALLARAYYTNGWSRSYATQAGYCNPDSPAFGGNEEDPYCIGSDVF